MQRANTGIRRGTGVTSDFWMPACIAPRAGAAVALEVAAKPMPIEIAAAAKTEIVLFFTICFLPWIALLQRRIIPRFMVRPCQNRDEISVTAVTV